MKRFILFSIFMISFSSQWIFSVEKISSKWTTISESVKDEFGDIIKNDYAYFLGEKNDKYTDKYILGNLQKLA